MNSYVYVGWQLARVHMTTLFKMGIMFIVRTFNLGCPIRNLQPWFLYCLMWVMVELLKKKKDKILLVERFHGWSLTWKAFHLPPLSLFYPTLFAQLTLSTDISISLLQLKCSDLDERNTGTKYSFASTKCIWESGSCFSAPQKSDLEALIWSKLFDVAIKHSILVDFVRNWVLQ